jgi:hypothetical protein
MSARAENAVVDRDSGQPRMYTRPPLLRLRTPTGNPGGNVLPGAPGSSKKSRMRIAECAGETGMRRTNGCNSEGPVLKYEIGTRTATPSRQPSGDG